LHTLRIVIHVVQQPKKPLKATVFVVLGKADYRPADTGTLIQYNQVVPTKNEYF